MQEIEAEIEAISIADTPEAPRSTPLLTPPKTAADVLAPNLAAHHACCRC